MTGYPVDVLSGTVALDRCRVALPLRITHGRSGINTQPDAPTCTFTWLGDTCPLDTGDPVRVLEQVAYTPATWGDPAVTWASQSALWGGAEVAELPAFTGVVDQVVAHEDGGPVVGWDVTCIGVQASLGVTPVLLDRPVETDVARVQAIAAAAGITVTVRGTPGPTLAADAIDTDALSALHQVCASSGGLLWQTPAGQMVYGTWDHREDLEPQVIACEVIGDGLAWAKSTDVIINHVTAIWGPEDAQEQDTSSDAESIGQPWGLRHQDVTTICAERADAVSLAQLILRRRAWPYWGTPTIVVHADRLDPAGERALARLDVSSAVLVPLPMAAPGPVPAPNSQGVVEGWVETWDASGHTVQLAAGDAARWVLTRIRTWGDVDGDDWAHWAVGSWAEQLVEGAAA